MTPILLGRWTPADPEWHEARRWRVGGSEIAAIVGWSPWSSREDLLREKATGERRKTGPAALRGALLESGISEWLRHSKGIDHVSQPGTYVDSEHDYALANPDGITTDDRLVEIKTVADRSTEKGWGRANTDNIPLYYRAQVEWCCGVLGIDSWILPVLHGATNGRPDLDFSLYQGRADATYFAWLLEHANNFISDLTKEMESNRVHT